LQLIALIAHLLLLPTAKTTVGQGVQKCRFALGSTSRSCDDLVQLTYHRAKIHGVTPTSVRFGCVPIVVLAIKLALATLKFDYQTAKLF
jgi:hypothetical protein